MAKALYVMVTSWKNHWIDIKTTYYKKEYIKFDENEITENMPTVFIKVNGNKKIEHIYEGKISKIEKSESKIIFEVYLEKEKKINDYNGYNLPTIPGWYKINLNEVKRGNDNDLLSPEFSEFFKQIEDTQDWGKFEELVYYLLKLIGITTIYRNPSQRQQGLPDGYFKIGNLIVIYDCTLSEDFENKKATQIDNYIHQIRQSSIKITSRGDTEIELNTTNCKKQVWIITKKQSKKIKSYEDVLVKAISVNSLKNFFVKRLKELESEDDCISEIEKIGNL